MAAIISGLVLNKLQQPLFFPSSFPIWTLLEDTERDTKARGLIKILCMHSEHNKPFPPKETGGGHRAVLVPGHPSSELKVSDS